MKKKSSSLDAFNPLFEKVGQLNFLHRILICIGAFLLLLALFAFLSYKPKLQEIKKLKTDLADLEEEYKKTKDKADQLPVYREKMKIAQNDFMLAKAVLPETREINSLLSSVSEAGQDAGLEELLFKPASEVKKDFYAQIPVEIKVAGSYHNVATFFDNVSRLYRIVNITDIEMKAGKSDTILNTSFTAVTYKFVEEEKKEENTKTTSRRTRR
jgi:type IV pilus assembly protein PilO